MTTLTRQSLRNLNERIEKTLAPLADELGVQIKCGGASFTPTNATIKLIVGVIGDSGDVSTPDADAFKAHAVLFGLRPEDLGTEFNYGAKTFKISGLRPRSRTKPILATDATTGKRYVFPANAVRAMLGRPPDTGPSAFKPTRNEYGSKSNPD